MNFQQDGHMAMTNPRGRVNYEPNSWGAEAGPRENPQLGHSSFAADVQGTKQRIRSETFSDHYSQARQFYISQLPIEQKHIGDALVFELSKVDRVDIRARAVSHLRNIDGNLAATVADGLGLALPVAAVAARQPITDLPPSDKLSIAKNGPDSFKGRKLGMLLSDGADAGIVKALIKAVEAEGAVYEVIAPKIAGVTLSDGTTVAAKHKIDGGPSVLFDAVAIVVSAEGAALLSLDAAAKDFATDAFAHCKYIGISAEAEAIFAKAGIADDLDEACLPLAKAADAKAFLAACRALRYGPRELTVDLDAQPQA
jgi:catalase